MHVKEAVQPTTETVTQIKTVQCCPIKTEESADQVKWILFRSDQIWSCQEVAGRFQLVVCSRAGLHWRRFGCMS